ncbi:hypothetical protein ACFQAT_01995 [Undibacterium arcticum]|uniref:Uncharacterized protein n=1 Tax=Undibacterium arcticum TaxID=1762892 RepID=A0ABV7F699_9BURK
MTTEKPAPSIALQEVIPKTAMTTAVIDQYTAYPAAPASDKNSNGYDIKRSASPFNTDYLDYSDQCSQESPPHLSILGYKKLSNTTKYPSQSANFLSSHQSSHLLNHSQLARSLWPRSLQWLCRDEGNGKGESS